MDQKDLSGAAGKAWREISRLLAVHLHAVSLESASAPPTASSRALHRAHSVEGTAAATTAATVRRRSRRSATRHGARPRPLARSTLAEVWSKLTRPRTCRVGSSNTKKGVYEFAGKAGENNRLFAFSADRYGPESAEPWSAVRPCHKKELGLVLTWMSRQTVGADFHLSFRQQMQSRWQHYGRGAREVPEHIRLFGGVPALPTHGAASGARARRATSSSQCLGRRSRRKPGETLCSVSTDGSC